jgi:hypothetical protein
MAILACSFSFDFLHLCEKLEAISLNNIVVSKFKHLRLVAFCPVLCRLRHRPSILQPRIFTLKT